jgi:hypothetical protein
MTEEIDVSAYHCLRSHRTAGVHGEACGRAYFLAYWTEANRCTVPALIKYLTTKMGLKSFMCEAIFIPQKLRIFRYGQIIIVNLYRRVLLNTFQLRLLIYQLPTPFTHLRFTKISHVSIGRLWRDKEWDVENMFDNRYLILWQSNVFLCCLSITYSLDGAVPFLSLHAGSASCCIHL